MEEVSVAFRDRETKSVSGPQVSKDRELMLYSDCLTQDVLK